MESISSEKMMVGWGLFWNLWQSEFHGTIPWKLWEVINDNPTFHSHDMIHKEFFVNAEIQSDFWTIIF